MAEELVILEIGQSNREPTGVLGTYLALTPEFNYAVLTPFVGDTYYGKAIETIRFLTFYNPEDAPGDLPAGAAPAPFASYDYSYYCKWLPWSSIEGVNGIRDNPAPVGFRYPNCFTLPKGPLLNVTPGPPPLPISTASYPGSVSSSVDLARRMSGYLKRRINVIQLAIPSSRLALTEESIGGGPIYKWGWFDPRIHNNWNPADPNSVFVRLRKTLLAAKIAAAAEGNTLRVVLVACGLSETDSQWGNARDTFATNAPSFIDQVRTEIYSAGISGVSPSNIPFVWAGLPDVPWGATNVSAINTVLQAQQKDDPYFQTYDTNGPTFTKNAGDAPHFDTGGIIALAAADFAAFLAIEKRATASFPDTDTITLAEMRALVRQVTERNTADTGQDATVIDQAVGEAYLDLIQNCGDSTWWLRQMMRVTLSSSPKTPVDLPRPVTRLLEIRPASDPLRSYDFSMIGHSDKGRVRIVTLGTVTNQVVDLHHQYEPRKPLADGDRLVIPAGYLESVKMGAALRVAKNTGNAALETKLGRDAMALRDQVCMHAQKVDRQRRQRLTGGLRRSNYGNQGTDPFGYDYPWQ